MSKRPPQRHQPRRFIPKLGRLEDRTLPAGNVTAAVFEGILYVVGDNASNQIWIAGQGGSSIQIRSLDNTTLINGQSTANFGGVVGGFHILMNDGDDTVSLSDTFAGRNLNIDMGAGNDSLTIFKVWSMRTTQIAMGAGNDALMISNSVFGKDTVIDGGVGDDIVTVMASQFYRNTYANGGTGANTFTDTNNFFQNLVKGNFNGGTPTPPNPTPTAPTANNDTGTVARGGTVTVNVAANDTAANGNILNLASLAITGAPAFGTATVNNDGTITYTNTNTTTTSAVDTFDYTIKDNAGTVSNVATVTITFQNTTAPTVTVATTAHDPTNTTPIPFTFTFSENVNGFTSSDIVVTNGSVADLTRLSTTSWQAHITPAAPGAVSVSLPAGVVTDNSGNANTASNTVTITFDNVAPVVTVNDLTTTSGTPTLTGTVDDPNATITITVGGQTFNGTVAGTNWSATVPTALADGTYTVSATAVDRAGNSGTGTGNLVINSAAAPVPTITSTETDPTPANPIPFKVTFDKDVTGFSLTGLTITNGTASNFVMVDAHTYTFDVAPTHNGLVTVVVNADAAHDSTGNGNTTATFSITSTAFAPTPAITTTAHDPTNQSPIPFTVTFDTDVTGFDITDLQITNGSATNFVMVNAHTYTFDVTATADGLVTVLVPAGAAQDSTGRPSVQGTFSITFDGTAPAAPVITGLDPASDSGTPGDGITNDTTPTFLGTAEAGSTVTVFSNDGSGPVSLGTAVAGANGAWSFTPTTPLAIGTYTITATATDAAGNVSPPSAGFHLVIVTAGPTPTITTTATDPTNLALIPFTVTFSADVTGFSAGGLTVVNGTVSNFVMVDAHTYTFDVAPTADGLVTVTVNADAAQDSAGNGNTAATHSITSERFNPSATITTTASDPTNLSPIPFTVTWSENVTGFAATGLTIGNGTVSNFVMVNAHTYTFDVTPTADGLVTVTVNAGAAHDASGNTNAQVSHTITSDRTAPPAPVITGLDPASDSGTLGDGITNDTTPTFTGTAEANSTVTIFKNDGSGPVMIGSVVASALGSWTFTPATPLADGTYTITATATDAAGNVSPASNGFHLVIDSAGATPAITTTAHNPTNLDPIPFTVTFNEDVTGFGAAGVSVLNGTVSNFVAVNARTYTFDVTPGVDGTVTVKVNAGAAVDAAGNGNAQASFSLVSDRTQPTGTIAPNSVGQIHGTASDATAGVANVTISIFNGSAYWDGTGFNSATQIFLSVVTNDNFATWSINMPVPGTYTANLFVSDKAGNGTVIPGTVIVT